MENENDKLPQLAAYKIFLDDIRYSKRQQWIITYYILLFHFGLFSLLELNALSFVIIFPCSLISTTVATIMLWIYYFDLKVYRKKKDDLAKELFGEEGNMGDWDYWFFTFFFTFFSWLGFALLLLSKYSPFQILRGL